MNIPAKMNSIIPLFGLLFLFSFHSTAQTDVVVNYYDGTSQNFSVTDDGKLYFESDNLVVVPGTSGTVTIPLSIIRKITFPLNQSLGIEDLLSENTDVFLFPNPTKDHFRIASSSSEKLSVRIYSTGGGLVLSGEYYANDLILIRNLESGLYLVTVNNKPFKLNKL